MEEKQLKALIFFGLIFLIIIAIALFFFFSKQIIANIFLIILLIAFILILWKAQTIIFLEEFERAVISRFGRVNRVGGPGWTFILPFIESYKKVDLRTKTIDVEKQDVITKDMVELKIDAVLYLHVKKDSDAVIKSVVEVEDFSFAAKTLVVSAIRNLVGSMTLAEVISNIDVLNEKLKKELEKIANKWGIEVEAVEMKDVDIPKVVVDAMHAEKAAIQEKLARVHRAEAQKAEIEAVQAAAEKLSDKTLAYYYIKALEEMSKGKGTKIIFPLEFSRLAETIAGKERLLSIDSKTINDYKKILEETIENAVKKAKEKEKKNILK